MHVQCLFAVIACAVPAWVMIQYMLYAKERALLAAILTCYIPGIPAKRSERSLPAAC